ncbi:hypothetical protein CEXT_778581 [Caerostris extrusa]|uniref:Uncharacterized protein n=1 Tax=Caerostris extrusa TaxID=172846 RepID=A0AAV4V5V3_CAEEX|nr:hypothetical protein CEXT_778581 [Caerostris extrusa]
MNGVRSETSPIGDSNEHGMAVGCISPLPPSSAAIAGEEANRKSWPAVITAGRLKFPRITLDCDVSREGQTFVPQALLKSKTKRQTERIDPAAITTGRL